MTELKEMMRLNKSTKINFTFCLFHLPVLKKIHCKVAEVFPFNMRDIHWLGHSHMTSYNRTVSARSQLECNSTKSMTSQVNNELLSANVDRFSK